MYTGPQIDTIGVFTNYFTVYLHVMTYTSGLPVMYPIACMHFMFVYWIYKTMFLKFYRKTATFDEMLALESIWYLKFGVFIHLCMGAFVFSNSNILSEGAFSMINDFKDQALAAAGTNSTSNDPKNLNVESLNVNEEESWYDRFSKGIGILYLVFFTLVIVLYIFKKTFIALVVYILKKIIQALLYILLCKCCRKRKSRMELNLELGESAAFSDDLIADMNLG
jgi:hypothetical protein